MNDQTLNLSLEDDLNFDAEVADIFSETTVTSEVETPTTAAPRELSFFRQIPVSVTLEVASTSLPLGELMQVGPNSIIELDKLNGEPLDVKVNGHLLGHAEVVVVNDKYGLRITSIAEDALNEVSL
ncbi:flagellar motor switch protein FliN [Vibrio astriarenae]|uniref:Flagellar motor switch protein FliN n=1 Tax=Vibrio astriarenae TaxID=1481923 RepID=A0A7Z2T5J3_9VIBR|nr:flagellar motor switch protein FliN [Vibrio astriarenae]QIA64553.1 flagellar motor switch protein FliN [Vibrio astriarenae]GAL14356.1 flagellar motor switch protein FliN [Vibrio sp. C7]